MRAKLLLVGGVALLLGACAGKTNPAPAPAPLNKQSLIGKWKSAADLQLVAGYEFAEDGTLKMNVQGMERPVQGRFTWSGERDLTLKYEATDAAKKAYQAAAQRFKEEVQERIKSGKLPERAGPSILAGVRDELAAEETFRVSLSEQPRLLTLGDPHGTSLRFEKAN